MAQTPQISATQILESAVSSNCFKELSLTSSVGSVVHISFDRYIQLSGFSNTIVTRLVVPYQYLINDCIVQIRYFSARTPEQARQYATERICQCASTILAILKQCIFGASRVLGVYTSEESLIQQSWNGSDTRIPERMLSFFRIVSMPQPRGDGADEQFIWLNYHSECIITLMLLKDLVDLANGVSLNMVGASTSEIAKMYSDKLTVILKKAYITQTSIWCSTPSEVESMKKVLPTFHVDLFDCKSLAVVTVVESTLLSREILTSPAIVRRALSSLGIRNNDGTWYVPYGFSDLPHSAQEMVKAVPWIVYVNLCSWRPLAVTHDGAALLSTLSNIQPRTEEVGDASQDETSEIAEDLMQMEPVPADSKIIEQLTSFVKGRGALSKPPKVVSRYKRYLALQAKSKQPARQTNTSANHSQASHVDADGFVLSPTGHHSPGQSALTP